MPPQKFAVGAISDQDFFGEARTMRTLHAMHARGAVLNKRDWWVKWTTRPEVRAKWLLEMEEALVKAHVTHVWSHWPARNTSGYEERALLAEIASIADETEKTAAMERILATVMYPSAYRKWHPCSEGERYGEEDEDNIHADQAEKVWKELVGQSSEDADEEATTGEMNGEHTDVVDEAEAEEEDEEDEERFNYDASAIDNDFPKVLARHKKLRSVAQVAWYVAMTITRDALRVLPPAEWTEDRQWELTEEIWSSENQEVVVRACTLISAVMRGGACTLDVLRKHLPDEERPNVLKLLQFHFTKIRVLLDNTKASVESQLDMIAKSLDLDADRKLPIHVPGPAPKTWMSDNCIPEELKNKFRTEIAAIENVPEEAKDWHPNSNNQVLNLVHPSLFCGVVDKTKLLAASEAPELHSDVVAHMQAILFASTPRTLAPVSSTRFQWLPCEIDVSESGDATVRTYINNLHPEDHTSLYGSIETIFSRFVPLFDHVLSTLVEPRAAPVYSPTPQYTLAGSRCQVIVKIAEIILTPENPSYNGGSWHIEGTKAESIVATGLYYFGCENITESRLSFCSFVEAPEFEHADHVGVGLTYGLADEKVLVQNLGSVIAMEDRCVVFPNILHHKVEPFELADPAKPGVRKILAFFLVNPTMDPIPSTAVVPPQQEEWANRIQEPALKKLRVPDPVMEQIKGMASERMSLEQAKEIRLELMKERSPAETLEDKYSDNYTYTFSLCEH